MQVYSTPITPPPTTISVLGISGICRIWSLLMMLRPLIGTLADAAGLVPVAMITVSALIVRRRVQAGHADRVRIDEAGHAEQHLDVVARKLRHGDVDLGLDHVLHAEGQIRHGDLFFHAVVDAVDVLVVVAGKVQHRFAHGLAGNGAGVDADAADALAPFDQSHALARISPPGSPPAAPPDPSRSRSCRKFASQFQ